MKCIFFFSSRRRHTRWPRDWSSDVCSSDLDMIEARLEEIYELSYREIRRMGYQDLPGGFVLTGGTMKIDGSLDLAQEIFHSNARIAIPDYIGVREPQFTVGVGTIQFAYRNAKIQGKELEPSLVGPPIDKVKVKKSRQVPKENKGESKVGSFFKYFFE